MILVDEDALEYTTTRTHLHAISMASLKTFIFGKSLSWKTFFELCLQLGRTRVAVVPVPELALSSTLRA